MSFSLAPTRVSVMISAVRKAARSLARDFGEVEHLQVSQKGPSDFVSAADKRAEQILYKSLSEARPGYGFVMEESGIIEGTDKTHKFIIDPLDGTVNFLHSIPHFAISVALEREEELISGVVYDLIRDELFWADKGMGAYLNNRKLQVSARKKIEDSVVATGIPHRGKSGHAIFLKALHQIMPYVSGVRRAGAASLDLAYLATGRYDAFWERNLKSWDIAAGIIIVKEAGGIVEDIDSDEKNVLSSGNILAANPSIFPILRNFIKI